MSWQYESTTLCYQATFTTTVLSPIIHHPGSLLSSILSRVVVPDASSWSPSFQVPILDMAARTHTASAHLPAILSAPNMRCSSNTTPRPSRKSHKVRLKRFSFIPQPPLWLELLCAREICSHRGVRDRRLWQC
jgi:hypothetical protein